MIGRGLCLVAGAGFEPATPGLLAKTALFNTARPSMCLSTAVWQAAGAPGAAGCAGAGPSAVCFMCLTTWLLSSRSDGTRRHAVVDLGSEAGRTVPVLTQDQNHRL
jgi:hypothetical protein